MSANPMPLANNRRASIRVSAAAAIALASLPSLINSMLSAQAPSARVYFDSLLSSLDGTTSVSILPANANCHPPSGSPKNLCDDLIAMRRAELNLKPDDIEDARAKLEWSLATQTKSPLTWYALGRVRLAASRAGMTARAGPLQTLGEDNVQGAAAALERALELDSGLAPAANLLAAQAVPFQDKGKLARRVTIFRRYRALLAPDALIDASLFELDAGSVDTAIVLLNQALASSATGVRRGFAYLTLARALYRNGGFKEGRAALLAGAGERDSAGIVAYQETISWVGDSTEMKRWAALTPEARPAWLAAFWSKRDVREGRAEGERLTEHFRRVNHAYEWFRMKLPVSGQQKVITNFTESQFQRRLVVEMEAAGWPLSDAGNKVFEFAQARVTKGAEAPFRAFKSQQTILDDRGMVYIRHGEPTDKIYTGVGTIQFGELPAHPDIDAKGRPTGDFYMSGTMVGIWRYERPAPNPPLLLYFVSAPFQGQTEPNTLVPTLLAEDPQTRETICVLDRSLCPTYLSLRKEIQTGSMSLLAVAEAAQKGKEAIRSAVTTDDYPLSFSKAVHPSVTFHVLDLAVGGARRLVVALALPGIELASDPISASDGATYPLRVQVMASRLSDGARMELDTTRRFAMPHLLKNGEYLATLTELPLPPGQWIATLVVSQPDGRGAVATLEGVRVPGPSTLLLVGDLVLGREESGLRWHSGPGGQSVPLNPLNTFPSGGSASLYVQLSELNPGVVYTATIELFEGTRAMGKPVLTISSRTVATGTREELSRSLVLTNLKEGRYVVQLTIEGGGEKAVTSAGLQIKN